MHAHGPGLVRQVQVEARAEVLDLAAVPFTPPASTASTAGPSTAGPTTAGPTTAGPARSNAAADAFRRVGFSAGFAAPLLAGAREPAGAKGGAQGGPGHGAKPAHRNRRRRDEPRTSRLHRREAATTAAATTAAAVGSNATTITTTTTTTTANAAWGHVYASLAARALAFRCVRTGRLLRVHCRHRCDLGCRPTLELNPPALKLVAHGETVNAQHGRRVQRMGRLRASASTHATRAAARAAALASAPVGRLARVLGRHCGGADEHAPRSWVHKHPTAEARGSGLTESLAAGFLAAPGVSYGCPEERQHGALLTLG